MSRSFHRVGRALLAATLVLLGARRPAFSQDAATEPAREPARRALLVGIGSYPAKFGWPELGGPAADVEAMRRTLVASGGFRAADVRVLSDAGATREAIASTFGELAQASRSDDLLLFYFAGHGSRLPDEDHDELDGWDETLIPYDAARAGGEPNDILDDDLREWIREANRHTEHVVLIFDCCSSGTNVRGELAAATRFVDPARRGFAGQRPSASAALAEPGSGYFLPALSYVALGACRANESAYEHAFEPASSDGKTLVRGLFTWCLEQELAQAGSAFSYADLGDRVRDAVQALQPDQTPVVEGPRAKDALFGGVEGSQPTFELRAADGALELLAGKLQGLRPGAELEVVAMDGAQLRTVGRVRVPSPGVQRSAFEWVAAPEAELLAHVDQLRARLLQRGHVDARLAIDLDYAPELAESASALAQRLGASPSLRLSRGAEAALWLEIFERDGAKRVRTLAPGGIELPLSSDLGSERELARLFTGLERLALARELCRNLRRDASATLRIEAAFTRLDEHRKPLGPLERDGDGVSFLREGERLGASLRNRSPVAVYVALVIVSPHGAVSVFSPSGDEPLPPGAEVDPAFDMGIDPGAEAFYASAPERFLWIATASPPASLEALAQPSALEPPSRGEESSLDPLGTEQALTAKDEWVTRLLEVRVVAKR